METVAAVAYFSPYHFHRIFKSITGETLNNYIVRKRLEKAAVVLMKKEAVNITALSEKYGFGSLSAFTRAFKNFYGISPSDFQKKSPGKFSKISQTESKNGQALTSFTTYLYTMNQHLSWMKTNSTITVKELPAMDLAYVSNIGDNNLRGAFEKLMHWAKPKGLMDVPDLKMLTIFHDSFKVTPPDKVRMSACIVLHQRIQPEGEIGIARIEKGKCIVGHFELQLNEFEKAWTGLFMWLNENGYKVAERNPFEIYYNDFTTHPEQKSIVDICIPVL